MSQQSSSGDLLGGFKPAQLCHLVAPVREEFERLFPKTFSMKQNMKFLTHIQTCFVSRRYKNYNIIINFPSFKRIFIVDRFLQSVKNNDNNYL